MLFLDPLYLVALGAALVLSLSALVWVTRVLIHSGAVPNRSTVTGSEAASRVLKREGLFDVSIQAAWGYWGNRYDARGRVLYLSKAVQSQDSVAAMCLAAHEVGHALKDADGHAGPRLRAALAPVARIAANVALLLTVAGFALEMMVPVRLGIVLYCASVLVQAVIFPIEFLAWRRAFAALERAGLIKEDEARVVGRALSGAALKYLAAGVPAGLLLARLLGRQGLLGRRG